MPITPTEAADIARKHGLTLSDAAGLAALANTLDEAETIAARFATPEVDTAARDLTRRLFGRTDQQPDDEPPPATPDPEPSPDLAARRFVHRLFTTD